jgi:hypothetical protein
MMGLPRRRKNGVLRGPGLMVLAAGPDVSVLRDGAAALAAEPASRLKAATGAGSGCENPAGNPGRGATAGLLAADSRSRSLT